jgi:hypothetical protein
MRLALAFCCWLAAFLTGTVAWAAPAKSPRGTAIVAANEEARAPAKTLARLVYRDPQLRPNFDEKMARALMGKADPGEDAAAKQRAEVASVVQSLATSDEAVRRRLLASTGKELGVSHMVLVEVDASGPRARVLRVSEQRFLGVTLAPKALEGGASDWNDSVVLLRGLARTEPVGTQRAAKPKKNKNVKPKKNGHAQNGASKTEPADDGVNLLTSPWFWGGLGVVVSVGVTVLVLSQTVFKDPDTVGLEGRVSP